MEAATRTDEDVLLRDGRDVRISTGETFWVQKWTVLQGERVLGPITGILEKSAAETDLRISDLISVAYDDIKQLVQVTLDLDIDKINSLPLEDLVELATQIFEVCLVRKDGGGLMGKMVRFGVTGGNLLLTAALGPERAAAMMQQGELERSAALDVSPGKKKPTKRKPKRRAKAKTNSRKH
jgi:hypothetical protein